MLSTLCCVLMYNEFGVSKRLLFADGGGKEEGEKGLWAEKGCGHPPWSGDEEKRRASERNVQVTLWLPPVAGGRHSWCLDSADPVVSRSFLVYGMSPQSLNPCGYFDFVCEVFLPCDILIIVSNVCFVCVTFIFLCLRNGVCRFHVCDLCFAYLCATCVMYVCVCSWVCVCVCV